MSVINILSDSYARIKNGYRLNLESVLVLNSKKVVKILDVLYLEGFIRGYNFNVSEPNKIKVLLKYSSDGESSLRDIKGISNSGKKVYVSVDTLWNISLKSNMGCFILSTSKGIMSLNDALKHNVGGELLCYVL